MSYSYIDKALVYILPIILKSHFPLVYLGKTEVILLLSQSYYLWQYLSKKVMLLLELPSFPWISFILLKLIITWTFGITIFLS